jgi:hypothetical protein
MASMHQPEQYRGPEHRQSEASPLRMARLIEGEIIPRLLMAHRGDQVDLPKPPAAFTAVEPLELARMTLRLEVFSLLAHIDGYLNNGVAIESIYLDLLAPTARVLGDFWDNDVCDFVDVTMGLWRLQQVVHELGSRAPCPSVRTRADRRVLFTVPPGDQHSFGLVMIEDFFRRAGWRTWSAPDAGLPEIGTPVVRADRIDGEQRRKPDATARAVPRSAASVAESRRRDHGRGQDLQRSSRARRAGGGGRDCCRRGDGLARSGAAR